MCAAGEKEADKSRPPAGPVGGVKPGLDEDEGKPLQGPEPLMGVQHLDEVEQGHMASGDEAVSLAPLSSAPHHLWRKPLLIEQAAHACGAGAQCCER